MSRAEQSVDQSVATEPRAGWGVIGMLAAAQFIMVLDTTVMNVSITQVVSDLGTTVVGLQTAITMYTLVMAAFMLVGGKIGDRWGAKRTFWIGMLVYGAGSLVTALSPNLAVLLLGWSLVEGLGAVLVIPAIAALTAATYQGRQRALCYGILGGVAGASMAAGPLIGGWVTATWTWRLVFAGETVVVLLIMLFLRLIPATTGRKGPMDTLGAVTSALGLGAIVLGVLQSSQWGWVIPKPGAPFDLLGLSPTLWLILLGGVLLGQGRHAEAEPLLLAGFRGMKEQEKAIPPAGRPRLPETVDRLTELYTDLGKPTEVAKWRAERATYPSEKAPLTRAVTP